MKPSCLVRTAAGYLHGRRRSMRQWAGTQCMSAISFACRATVWSKSDGRFRSEARRSRLLSDPVIETFVSDTGGLLVNQNLGRGKHRPNRAFDTIRDRMSVF